jgi:CheY-like chemotaxis protein
MVGINRTTEGSRGQEERDLAPPYDLVFLDCQMPQMNGYEAVTEIRRREGFASRVTIIALTAEVMSGTREQCLAAGMDDYISKPIRHQDLTGMLRNWLPPAKTQPAV